LEFSDLSEGDGSGFESVGFLDAGDDRGRLPGDFLGRKLLAGHLLCCGLPSGLLGSGHLNKKYDEMRSSTNGVKLNGRIVS